MRTSLFFAALILSTSTTLQAAAPPACDLQINGELQAGQPFTAALPAGLKVYFQPIASGWILRILPAAGPLPAHDYAELATPPYQSVSPLSISTDFSFRAQDAVGWNPRRFRFATSAESFDRLQKAWQAFENAGATPPAPLQVELSSEIAQTASGTLTILDARLIPGTADQWKMAAAVASHFTTTAHTLAQSPDGSTSPLGKILWLRFRLNLDQRTVRSEKSSATCTVQSQPHPRQTHQR